VTLHISQNNVKGSAAFYSSKSKRLITVSSLPWREGARGRGIVSGFTLTHSPYPSGNKSSLDSCPPFLPSREREGNKQDCRVAIAISEENESVTNVLDEYRNFMVHELYDKIETNAHIQL
jgi:hypothetical protein